MKDHVNEFLAERKAHTGKTTVRAMYFKRGGAMSVQASSHHYCSPKNDTGPYTSVEVLVMSPRLKVPKSFGKPSEKFDNGERLWGFLPVSVLNAEIERRGGIAK
jgi:hypothetical protein